MAGPIPARMETGDWVEVRSRFHGSWSAGFVIAEATEGACRLRRMSDGAVLPVGFDWQDIRAASPGGPAGRSVQPRDASRRVSGAGQQATT